MTPCRSTKANTVRGVFRQDSENRRVGSDYLFSSVQSQIRLKSNEELRYISNRDTLVNNLTIGLGSLQSCHLCYGVCFIEVQISNMLT